MEKTVTLTNQEIDFLFRIISETPYTGNLHQLSELTSLAKGILTKLIHDPNEPESI